MKYYPITLAMIAMSLLIPTQLLSADLETYKNFRDPQERLDQDYPVPPGSYTIRIDDRTFIMTIPQGRTAATYNRENIDTQYYREQVFGTNYRREKTVGLIGFRRKDETGIWPFVNTYGETGIGASLYLAEEWESKIDRTSDKAWMWADYRTLESLVKMTKGFNYIYDAQGNRLGKKDIPRDVVVINGRQWAREHYEKGGRARAVAGLAGETVDTYYTGISENSYIRLIVVAPYTASSYPKDKERPEWVKQSSAFIAQALTSIKISAPAGSTEPDFFTVDESQNTPIEMLVP
ncbi:hypothetical protein C3Y98_09265 [Methylotenera oryzisoli]|uniref:Uncharacterized protein n=1 Tax=Methylotenera oryzisoli TaxID=2080758 RepID=A0A4Y9VRC2_9PROT|nr:hypothetical protein [Methylotenera oryzisoli]TFW70849.1 hypothetical protein C3Y98_09265 [Methylotenera oryzisoli]